MDNLNYLILPEICYAKFGIKIKPQNKGKFT